MASSYLILDEYMRFLDKDNTLTSDSILDVGVDKALSQVHWDEEAFQERGGLYDWSKENESKEQSAGDSSHDKLDW